MHIEFAPVDEKYLKDKVEDGYYTNLSEAVRDAVRRMRETEQDTRLQTLRALLAKGLEQAERGETVPYTSDFMERAMQKAVQNSREKRAIPDEVKG